MPVGSDERSKLLDDYFSEHQHLVRASLEKLRGPLLATADALVAALRAGGHVLAFGNGGSAAEASHFVAELVGRFSKAPRRPLPAIALASDPAVVTCIGNDFGFDAVFERQIEALVQPGDAVFAFTTSGESSNVARGVQEAERKGAITVALTGATGLKGARADYLLDVPSTSTSLIQEVHLILVHLLCVTVDRAFIGTAEKPTVGHQGVVL
jgi:D-sedoheptulose 7-phosphate isomerase